MKAFENLSISKKISLTVFTILCFTLSIYLVIFFVNNDAKTYQRVEEENNQLSSLLTQSVVMAMAAGADDTTPFVENLEKFEKIKDVRIIPTHLINVNKNTLFDQHEKEVYNSKKEAIFYEDFEDEEVLRSIKLIKADQSCIECHDVEKEDILAVVSIRQSLESTKSELASQKFDAIWIGGLAALLTFAMVYFFVNRRLGIPIKKLSTITREISEGNYKKRIDYTSKDELGQLAKSFNDMAEDIQYKLQYLDYMPVPVYAIDSDLVIRYTNKKGAELIGKEKDTILGSKCYENIKTSICNTNNCFCKKAVNGEKIESKEINANLNEKEMPIQFSGAPILDREGKVVGTLETINDLTDSKEKENYLQRNTQKILNEMSKLAEGDLTVSLNSEKKGDIIDNLFLGFNKAVLKVREMISQVSEAVAATSSASAEISSSSEQMAAGAQEQSSQSMEVASAINQMTKTILDTSQNISLAAERTQEAGLLSEDGLKIVKDAIMGMNRISDVVNEAVKTVEELGKSSEKIGDIVKVINEIADQTNLLALNAAIEAARAGEHGRGFAVVADEVRKLAERTTGATSEISVMISGIQSDTENAVNSIYSGTEEVNKGKELTNRAGESLEKINTATLNVIDLVTHVATASEEQSATSEQITRSIEGISQVTQESAVGIEQIARTADDLSRLTENLQNMMSTFKIYSTERQEDYVHVKSKSHESLV
jgi:methyl-accepting chemotaxis protein